MLAVFTKSVHCQTNCQKCKTAIPARIFVPSYLQTLNDKLEVLQNENLELKRLLILIRSLIQIGGKNNIEEIKKEIDAKIES